MVPPSETYPHLPTSDRPRPEGKREEEAQIETVWLDRKCVQYLILHRKEGLWETPFRVNVSLSDSAVPATILDLSLSLLYQALSLMLQRLYVAPFITRATP